MSIQELLKTNSNVSVTINALDLREAFLSWTKETSEKEQTQNVEEQYLTTKEVAGMIPCDRSTLWRWEKENYLTPLRIGNKVRYRLSDIVKIMEGK